MEEATITFWEMLGNGWNWYWFVTKAYAISSSIILMVATTAYILFYSLRLNYHHYLKHGYFVFFCDGTAGAMYDQIESIAKKHNIWLDPEFLPWVHAFVTSVVMCFVIFVLSLIWPITLIIILPLIIIRLIAYRKRRKIVFLQKLEGKND